MKKLFILCSLLLGTTVQAEQIDTLQLSSEFTAEQDAQNYFSKNKASFAWDLHNVLVSRDKTTFTKGGFGNLGSTTKSWKEKVHFYGQLTHAMGNFYVWKGIKSLIKSPYGKNKITESYFNMLKSLGYNLLYKELIQFANNIFVETPGIAELLTTLETTRTEDSHVLFSNIGACTLEDIHTRNLFPNIFNGKRFLKNSINNVCCTSSNGIYKVWKSKPEAYTGFEEYSKTTDTKCSIIFIDDKLKNIKAAPKEWNCILFTSVEQLKADLKRLGIIE